MDNKELFRQIRSTVECANGNHYFIPYNTGNLICKKCGRFAKVGYFEQQNKPKPSDDKNFCPNFGAQMKIGGDNT